jgi:iron complex transport system substrate-binding protein
MARFPLRSVILVAAALGAIGAVWAGSRPAAPATPPKPKRIVSVNLCADQLVIALADRDQIAGVTRNATDVQMSGEAARARGLPIMRDSAEQVMAIDPDLVVGAPASRRSAIKALKGKQYPTLDLKPADTFEDIVIAIRQTAAAVGHPARGEAMIAKMRSELAAIPRIGGGKVAAYYQRRGYMTGTGTLIDDIMNRVGLVNLAGKLGKPAIAQVSLEEMVAARPDYLIVESATNRVTDQGTEMLHHPALAKIPRISIPQAWSVCGSPAYVLAARGIAEQIARHR